MKPMNKRLLTTAGLFVAFCGLTSFNTFNQSVHLTAADSEGSITLAQTSPTQAKIGSAKIDRKENRDGNDPQRSQSSGLKESLAKIPGNAQEQQKVESKDGKPVQASYVAPATTEASACPDGKCGAGESQKVDSIRLLNNVAQAIHSLNPEEQNLILSKYSEKDQGYIRKKAAEYTDNNEEDVEENICAEGSYKERIQCFEKESKTYSKVAKKGKHSKGKVTREDRENFEDAVSDFIEEIAMDTDLSPREMNRYLSKIARFAKGNRDLLSQIKLAQNYQQVSARNQAFADQLQREADQLSNMDQQIAQMEAYNPYQANMLKIQRYQMLNGIKTQIASFRMQYKSAIPSVRSGESSLATSIRSQMTEDYASMVSPFSQVIDAQLSTLEDLPVAVTNPGATVTTTPGQNPSVFGPGTSNTNASIVVGAQPGAVYNSMDPRMTGMDITRMTPAQQVQARMQGQIPGQMQTMSTAGLPAANGSFVPSATITNGTVPGGNLHL